MASRPAGRPGATRTPLCVATNAGLAHYNAQRGARRGAGQSARNGPTRRSGVLAYGHEGPELAALRAEVSAPLDWVELSFDLGRPSR